jgi:hypothetical protein
VGLDFRQRPQRLLVAQYQLGNSQLRASRDFQQLVGCCEWQRHGHRVDHSDADLAFARNETAAD